MTKAKRKKIFISKPKTPYRKGYGCPYDKRILYCGLGCCEDCRIPNVYEQGKKEIIEEILKKPERCNWFECPIQKKLKELSKDE